MSTTSSDDFFATSTIHGNVVIWSVSNQLKVITDYASTVLSGVLKGKMNESQVSDGVLSPSHFYGIYMYFSHTQFTITCVICKGYGQ